jgi:hypothetical protein
MVQVASEARFGRCSAPSRCFRTDSYLHRHQVLAAIHGFDSANSVSTCAVFFSTLRRPPWGIVNDKHIEPHIPVWEKSQRDDGTFSRSDFQFDEHSNSYECPAGKQLTTTGRATSESTVLFRSRNEDCAGCAHKQRCCPNTPNRRIARSSTKVRAMWHVLYAQRRPTSSRARTERRWRCCLPTSNAS